MQIQNPHLFPSMLIYVEASVSKRNPKVIETKSYLHRSFMPPSATPDGLGSVLYGFQMPVKSNRKDPEI